jgi:hypothetical protein
MKANKAELLDLAFDNLPRKCAVVDEAAAKPDIDFLRSVFALRNNYRLHQIIFSSPAKHCMFNPSN